VQWSRDGAEWRWSSGEGNSVNGVNSCCGTIHFYNREYRMGDEAKTDLELDQFHEASRRGNVESLVDILSKTANKAILVNKKGSLGNTALNWASAAGHKDVVDALFAEGAEVNTVNDVGDTPLHQAVWRGHKDVVQALLQRGADSQVKNKDGKMAYDLARDDEIKGMLTQTEAKSNVVYSNSDDEDE
jgi:ankyrin repeat protein